MRTCVNACSLGRCRRHARAIAVRLSGRRRFDTIERSARNGVHECRTAHRSRSRRRSRPWLRGPPNRGRHGSRRDARQRTSPLPTALCAIHRVSELAGIRVDPDGAVLLGALASHADIAAHPLLRERFSGLAEASAIVGSHATRNVGTIGGNIMNGSPAMDAGAPLICAGAIAVLSSTRGSRNLPIADLFLGPGRTRAANDELATSVLLPAPPPGTGSCYARLEYRRHMEIAVVGVGCQLTLGADDRVCAASIAITALAPTIHRIPDAEALLIDGAGDTTSVENASQAVAAASSPISDIRASDAYRRAMAAVIARRAIRGALVRAAGGTVPIPASLTLKGTMEV
jgi:CO/xanthine dehydrogenase FAD-binding subunit